MIAVEDWYAVFPLCIAEWERAIEIDTAIVEGPGWRDCIGMERRDDVGARREILGEKNLEWTKCQHCRRDEF